MSPSTRSRLGLIGRWVAGCLVVCLAWIGFLHLTRGTAVRHVRGVAADGTPIGGRRPDHNLVGQLEAAARRGVDVRILTAGPQTDVNIVRHAGRASYATLLAAGVRIYEWRPTTLHAKTFVVDGQWSTIGSMNFDNRSMALNDEATLMVLDPAVGASMNRVFFDDLEDAQEISAEVFAQRSWMRRLLERAASVLTRLL